MKNHRPRQGDWRRMNGGLRRLMKEPNRRQGNGWHRLTARGAGVREDQTRPNEQDGHGAKRAEDHERPSQRE
jgi:hypothetical protein